MATPNDSKPPRVNDGIPFETPGTTESGFSEVLRFTVQKNPISPVTLLHSYLKRELIKKNYPKLINKGKRLLGSLSGLC